MKLASIVFFLSVMCLVTATHAGDLSDVLGRKGAKIENSSDGESSEASHPVYTLPCGVAAAQNSSKHALNTYSRAASSTSSSRKS